MKNEEQLQVEGDITLEGKALHKVLRLIRFDKKDIPLIKPFLEICDKDYRKLLDLLESEAVKMEEINLSVAKRFRKLKFSTQEKALDVIKSKNIKPV